MSTIPGMRARPRLGLAMNLMLLGVQVGSALIHALTISLLWGWYVAPIFGWPRLSTAGVFGLLLLIATVRVHVLDKGAPLDATEPVNLVTKRTVHVAFDAVMVGLGWAGTFWL